MGQLNETAQSTKDCISRQAAIDMIRLYREDEAVDLDELESSIAMMPSAQPEPEHTMEEFMYGQELGDPEDGSL